MLEIRGQAQKKIEETKKRAHEIMKLRERNAKNAQEKD